jgi:hypothetical protein
MHRIWLKTAEASYQKKDPLVLDLDGDGIETISRELDISFDHNRNGFAEQTGWLAPDDGFLALDRETGMGSSMVKAETT